MEINNLNTDYRSWLVDLKSQIRTSRLKASFAVNASLIGLYWDLGKMISEKENVWGKKLIPNLSKDLREEFPDMTGFSTTNLKYCKNFYNFYQNEIGQQPVDQLQNIENQYNIISQQPVAKLENDENQIGQQPVAQIPWSHNILIFTKSKSFKEAQFYIYKTIENQWSRNVLALQIESQLFERQGKSVNNFSQTLSEPFSDLAKEVIKDPYVFDFLSLGEDFREKDIENQLIDNVQKFLLELGKGFAFVGRQYNLKVSENDYYLDLLFYHIHLKCYVVIELKNTKFIPEFAGKMNFYLSAVDDLLKLPEDQPTIGLLICKTKDNIEAEFALRGISKPIGVSEFQLSQSLPENLKSSLPTVEEIERELSNLIGK